MYIFQSEVQILSRSGSRSLTQAKKREISSRHPFCDGRGVG